MMLNAHDEQLAFDYITYMMIGSFFGGVKTVNPAREEVLRMRYLLMKKETQYELESRCERFFRQKIQPLLPETFLKGLVHVRFERSSDGMRTAVVFESARWQLWLFSVYGGKVRVPVIKYRFGLRAV